MVKEPPYVKQLSTKHLSKIGLKRIVQKSIVRIVNTRISQYAIKKTTTI